MLRAIRLPYSVARSFITKKNVWERETSAVLSLATLQMKKPSEVRNLKALYNVENIEIELSHLIISLERNTRELQSEREKVGSLEIQLAHLEKPLRKAPARTNWWGAIPSSGV